MKSTTINIVNCDRNQWHAMPHDAPELKVGDVVCVEPGLCNPIPVNGGVVRLCRIAYWSNGTGHFGWVLSKRSGMVAFVSGRQVSFVASVKVLAVNKTSAVVESADYWATPVGKP